MIFFDDLELESINLRAHVHLWPVEINADSKINSDALINFLVFQTTKGLLPPNSKANILLG